MTRKYWPPFLLQLPGVWIELAAIMGVAARYVHIRLPLLGSANGAMNGTPRLRSAYPSTPWKSPKTERRHSETNTTASPGALSPRSKAVVDTNEPGSTAPLIPLTLLDAPTQRCYVAAFYIALWAWRLVDYSFLVSNDTDSPWQWMKWTAMDGVFLYGIPELRIPWLEWSSTTITLIFLLHAILNGILMFRVPLPLEAWVMALVRLVYDRELAVSEKRVNPDTLLHRGNLITGKQIIHILPEGSAMLNPARTPLCVDQSHSAAFLPIFINQTDPIEIELLRIDIDTNTNETIQISSKEAKKMKKQADRELKKQDPAEPRILHYPVKKTGLYRLMRVLDESKLEVQRRASDTLVVPCPHGMVKTVPTNKCFGDLSDFNFHVVATPPLKIKYRKTINDEDSSKVQLTLHPENLDSPLARAGMSQALIKLDSTHIDLAWARAQEIRVPVNETFGVGGRWKYFLEEIRDGCGNVVNYTRADDARIRQQSSGSALEQAFQVHQRPRISFQGCTPQRPLKVAKSQSVQLPMWLNPTGQYPTESAEHRITYSFSKQQDDGGTEDSVTHEVNLAAHERGPEVTEAGIYRLEGVATNYCSGAVLEPSSCLLSNPPMPDLSVSSQNIPHQCEGNSVGLRVDLDMVGTPPFHLSYEVRRDSETAIQKVERIAGMRGQLEFRPQEAGTYFYKFTGISDAVYATARPLNGSDLSLQQAVKPTALARFVGNSKARACIDDSASFQVLLTGEGPWSLEYDLIHQGKRVKQLEKNIQRSPHTLVTPKLTKGGQYTISLTSVSDKARCKISLDREATVDVRQERPSAAFGQIEAKSSTLTLQGKQVSIPLRLSGEGPWDVTFSHTASVNDDKKLYRQRLNSENAHLSVQSAGAYSLESVTDRSCPGVIDQKAHQFQVDWIARPLIQISGAPAEASSGVHIKPPVCEGAQDGLELSFTGTPPYHIKYEVTKKPRRGQTSVSTRSETIGLHASTIGMDTSQAGQYEYRISELGDQLYDHDRNRFSPAIIRQQVHALPSAEFMNSGKTYNYCKEDASQYETIPIGLVGNPPFSIEVGIRHHSSNKPDVIPIPQIRSNRYDFQIPHKALSLGSHIVSILKISDANGCQRFVDAESPGVRVNVVDVPSISPMEQTQDFCVGDRISYTLAGTPPFNIFYTFEGVERKASTSTNSFRRIAERPGVFTITAVSDKSSTDACRAKVEFTKTIHELPSARMSSRGRNSQIDIHEGGEAELTFEFGGTPPFEFTYTRSTNSVKGKPAKILETRTEVSTAHVKTIPVSEEGTYEVVSVRDKFCAVSTLKKKGSSSQMLKFNN